MQIHISKKMLSLDIHYTSLSPSDECKWLCIDMMIMIIIFHGFSHMIIIIDHKFRAVYNLKYLLLFLLTH